MGLIGLRFYVMGNKPPLFSSSDNPAADSDSLVTWTLTFLYLPTFNAWLLLCPATLSFDWSMGAIPLIHSISDIRNLYTVVWYNSLAVVAFACVRKLSVTVSGAGGVDRPQVLLVGLSVPFIPATNLFFYVGFVVAERILYIPSIGFCLLAAEVHCNCSSALLKKVQIVHNGVCYLIILCRCL